MWKNIFFTYEVESTFEGAWQQTLYLAALSGSRIKRLEYFDPSNPKKLDTSARILTVQNALQTLLDQTAEQTGTKVPVALGGIDQEKLSEPGPPGHERIIELAQRLKPVLIVMPTHGRQILEHFLLDTLAEKVLQHCQVPILSVRNPEPREITPFGYRRIVVACDFQPSCLSAIKTAQHLAASSGAQLDVVHVLDFRLLPEFPGSQNIQDDQLVRLKKWCEDHEIQNASQTVEVGVPSTEIVHHADETNADLIVVGSHGRSGLSHFLLGSVAEQVLRKANCPVLVVK
ncbi:MAG: universal stress protein [Acidobacteria bacterium]|nr:universal stress protein [Acidobacteriota bacterium]